MTGRAWRRAGATVAAFALAASAPAEARDAIEVAQVDVTAALDRVTQVEQVDARRSLILVQSGESQRAVVTTQSVGGRILVDQSGSRQDAEVEQSGAFAWTDIRQSGLGNAASVRQEAPRAWAQIVQSGSGNVARVVQGAALR